LENEIFKQNKERLELDSNNRLKAVEVKNLIQENMDLEYYILSSAKTQEIVDQNFDCGDGHNYSTFKLNLKEGQHQITVTSSNGNAGLDVVFTVDKPLWLSLSYWGKNHFQLYISERPLVFI